jgi:N-acetylmuramoyl-L-alanine amidase
MTVAAEETSATTTPQTTTPQTQAGPGQDSGETSDSLGTELQGATETTSNSVNQDELTGEIDEDNLIQTGQSVISVEDQVLPEVVINGERELPDNYQYWINLALDKKNMPIDVLINGRYLKTTKDALVINNTTYVPVRALFQAFGYKDISFDSVTYTVITKGEQGEFQFLLNTNEVLINGVSMNMEKPSLIVNGVGMVPLRFVSEYFKFSLVWDAKYYSVNLINADYPIDESALGGRFYSYEEFLTFTKLIMREAGSVSYETKHGVASVVLNQVRHPGLENTLHGVIFAVSRSPHFPPAHKANFQDTVPNKECIMAAKMTLRGENSAGTCIFFNTRPFKGKTIYKVSDGVYFCY